jgi:chemotaxis protein histidine kinase CheA
LTAAVNNQLADYNPLNSVLGGVLPKGEAPNPPLTTIAQRVTAQMKREIGADITVLNTIIPLVTFDSQTQSRINQLQQQIALTRIAEQAKETADAQAKANEALAASVNKSPNVLVSSCLDILSTMVKDSQPVPAGFSCWPGGSLAGVIASPTTGVGK